MYRLFGFDILLVIAVCLLSPLVSNRPLAATQAAAQPEGASANARRAGAAEITDIRHSVSTGHVRVVIQTDMPAQFEPGTAQNPPRIFFDLRATYFRPAGNSIQVGDSTLRRIRVAEYQPGITRVVLDLAAQTSYSTAVLSNPPRLVVDLKSDMAGASAPTGAVTSPAKSAGHAPTPATVPKIPPSAMPTATPPAAAPPVRTKEPGMAVLRSPAPPATALQPKFAPAATAQAELAVNLESASAMQVADAKGTLQAAEQGVTEAQFRLGNLYMSGRGVARDPAEAVRWYTRAAQQGHAVAGSNLGVLYANGWGVTQSNAEAVRWFRRAAEQGDGGGASNLGAMYLKGRGVPQSDTEAAKWLTRAAEHDVAEAQYSLATLYVNGRGVPRDDAQAAKWLQKSAAQGYKPAQATLGQMYLAGSGVPRDVAQAVGWLKKAETPEACYQIGLLYLEGRGVPKDESEAVSWLLKAAAGNLPEAEYRLGEVFRQRDPVIAYAWYAVAGARGHQAALAAMNALAPSMSADQIAEAQRRALTLAGHSQN